MAIDTNKKILLVEDSGATRKMELMIIKQLGYSDTIEALDGIEAVEILQSDQQVDLVISDWNMPNMDGLELLKWLRADAKHANTPFIMATGQGQKSQAAVAQQAGVSGMVPKPFSAADLSACIEEIEVHGKVQEKSGKGRKIQKTADGKVIIEMAHIQITDHVVLGVLKYFLESGEYLAKNFVLKTRRMPSWNPVAQGLEEGELDGALVLAPIAMDLYNYNVPIKLVLLAHKNGSIFVRNRKMGGGGRDSFLGKVFYIPHQLSVHHMLSHIYLSELGLHPGVPGEEGVNVSFEVVPPIKMPEFLAKNPKVSGFMVAEPLGTKAIAANSASLQFLSAEAWPDHPCCVVTMRDEMIQQHPEVVQEFVNLMVKAGQFVKNQPGKAAEIAVKFLDPEGELRLNSAVLKNVLTEPEGITTNDLYPVKADLDNMQKYMVTKMGLGSIIDLNKFIDARFADIACADSDIKKVIPSKLKLGEVAKKVLRARSGSEMTKIMLNKEGKYLLFSVGGEEYGLGIMKMKEIVGLQDIVAMPNMPKSFRGVINLRDKIIPILDLKIWFGEEPTVFHERTSVIIVETDGKTKSNYLGMIADNVTEIVDIKASDVETPPSFGYGDNVHYILAMAKIAGSVKVLLDVDQIVDSTSSPVM